MKTKIIQTASLGSRPRRSSGPRSDRGRCRALVDRRDAGTLGSMKRHAHAVLGLVVAMLVVVAKLVVLTDAGAGSVDSSVPVVHATVTKPKDRAAASDRRNISKGRINDRAVIRRWCSHRRRRWNHRCDRSPSGQRERHRRRPSRRGRPSGEPASAEVWPRGTCRLRSRTGRVR